MASSKFRLVGLLVIITVLILTACNTASSAPMEKDTASDTAMAEKADAVMAEDEMMEDESEEAMASDDDEMMADEEAEMADHEDEAMMDDEAEMEMAADDDEMMAKDDTEMTDHEDEAMMEDESEMSADDEMMADEEGETMMDDTSEEAMSADDEMMTEDDEAMMMELPDWFSADLLNAKTGETFKVSDFQGKTVLVETMAIWCSNCLKQQQELKAWYESMDDNDDLVVLVLDIDTNDSPDKLKDYTDKHGFPWHYAVASVDVAREIGALYGDQFLNPPSTPMLIIDSHGDTHPLPFGHKTSADLTEALTPFLGSGIK